MAYRIFFLGTIFTFIVSSATAHTLWVNTFESRMHLPAHVLCSIGWGHTTPLDDLPQTVELASYTLYGPDLKETPLPMPMTQYSDSVDTDNGLTILSGDIGARKIILKEGCKQGTYQVGVKSQDNYYTHYLDQNNKKKWAIKPKDEVTDAKKIFRGMLYRGTAVSYFTVEEWQAPQSLGYDLEILPLTDLSDIRVGDLVQFRILFRGEKLTTSPEVSIEYITAVSDSFGGSDRLHPFMYDLGWKGTISHACCGTMACKCLYPPGGYSRQRPEAPGQKMRYGSFFKLHNLQGQSLNN